MYTMGSKSISNENLECGNIRSYFWHFSSISAYQEARAVSTADVTLPKSLDSIEWEVRGGGDGEREVSQSASFKRNQLSGEEQTRRHAWSDNDLFGQKWTNQDMSENTYDLELSASCQNLSKAINSTTKCVEDEDKKIPTEVWNSFESIYSHDYYKYRRTMEEDANNKDLANSVFYDYEKLLREECDCTKRIIPDLKRDSSVCSARDRLIKDNLIFEEDEDKKKVSDIITKLLILITILSIIFLFWIQNSHYHLIDNIKRKYHPKYGYGFKHEAQ